MRLCPILFLAFAANSAWSQSKPETGDSPELAFGPPTALINETNVMDRPAFSDSFPSEPGDYFARIQSARRHLRSGDCEAAVPLLEDALEQFADDGTVWGLLGKCLAGLHDAQPAVEAFVTALRLGVTPWDAELDLNPNDIMIEIAEIYAKAGDAPEAAAWLRKGLMARFDEQPALSDRPGFSKLRNEDPFTELLGLAPDGIQSRDDQWRYDIAALRERVSRLHYYPTQFESARDLDLALQRLAASVPELEDEQITARIDLFIGGLGSGHDLFWPVNAPRGSLLPFAWKLYVFTNGIYVIDAADPSLIGARVEYFGETSAAEAYARVVKAFPGDNALEAAWMAPRHLSQSYTLEALGVIENAETASIRIVDRYGQSRNVSPERHPFTPLSPALTEPPDVDAPLYLSRLSAPYWMDRIEALDALYVQINEFVDTPDMTVEEFADRIHSELAESGVRNVILDLRHSAGGNGYLTPPMLRTLIAFDAGTEKSDLFVIIGRNTFSASQNFITDLQRIATPFFVGEPSGSRPNAVSESGNFTLPFSGLSGMLSSQLHQHSWPEDHRNWIAPDLPVGLSSEEFFSGQDPALKAIAARIHEHSGDEQ